MDQEHEKKDGLEGRVGAVETRVGGLKVQVGTLTVRVDEGFKRVDERFKRVDENFKRVDAQFEKVDARLEKLETKFDDLSKLIVRASVGIVVGIVISLIGANATGLLGADSREPSRTPPPLAEPRVPEDSP